MGKELKKMGLDYPRSNFESETKNKILHVATLLFAKQGYAAVSMKNIAKEVGIRASSLYNHFKSKADLWHAVLDHQEKLYTIYFERLGEELQRAVDFPDVLDIMFYELKQVVNIFNYYGFSLVMTEQLRDEKAARIFLDTFVGYSISYIAGVFDQWIERGEVKPFDTRTIATFFMHSVLVNNHLRVHEDLGRPIPYDVTDMWEQLRAFILVTVE